MEFILISGLSGAGKSRAASVMEDMGFFCVDNLPAPLIPKFAELGMGGNGEYDRVALVTDIRGGTNFNSLFQALEDLKTMKCGYRIVFMEASDEVIIRRYKESRRNHPLAEECDSLEEAIDLERKMLAPLKERADWVIDTTNLSARALRGELLRMFSRDAAERSMEVRVLSFGFKHGIPTEADLVFDVRCLPNPFYIEELKHLTGLDEPVYSYVMKWEQTKGVVQRLISLIDYMLPLYCDEGKSQLVIAIGCTGGKHRSVALAQLLYDHLLENGHRTSVNHRDIQK